LHFAVTAVTAVTLVTIGEDARAAAGRMASAQEARRTAGDKEAQDMTLV
jgi:hypothetical protein